MNYPNLILRWRYLIVLLCSLLVIAFGTGLSKLELSTNLEVFFSQDDPQLIAYDAVRDTYTRDDNLFLVFQPANGQVFTPENLAIVEDLTDQAWRTPYAIRVDSVTNFQHTQAQDDDLLVQPLVEDAMSMSPQAIEQAREVAVNEPLIRGKLITPSAHLTAINITIELPETGRSEAIPEAVAYVRDLRTKLQAEHPGSDLKVTGKVAGNLGFTEAAVQDMSHIVPLALLIALLCIGGFLYMSSGSIVTAFTATFATILVIVGSVIVGLGAAGWLGIEISPPVANAPTVILTLSVADCMHLLVSYFQSRRRGDSNAQAVAHTLKLNRQPVFLTSLTTVIGFLALNSSEAPPFHDLGNTVAIGIAAGWLLAMLLLPALLVILPMPVKGDGSKQNRQMLSLANLVLRRPRLFFGFSVIFIAVTAVGIGKNQLYDVWAEYFHPSMQIRQDSDFARQHLNGFNTLEFSLNSGENGGVADPDYLQQLEDFANWLRAQPEVMHVTSFTDIMKRLNRNMHGDDDDWYRLPQQRDLAAQYLLLYEFSLPFGLDLTNQINLDKSATRLIAGLHSSSTLAVLGLQERAGQWLRDNTPAHFFHPGASSDAMFAHTGKRNVISMLYGSLLGLLAISLVIAIALRSVGDGLLSLLLNLLPMLVGFGLWGYFHGRIGMGLSAVTGLTMGIVVDFTVHLLSKYRQGQKHDGLGTPDAIRYAFSTVGPALMVTTVVLIVNFGLLVFSVFTLNSELGVLTAGIILVALLQDLLFLPPLLMLIDRFSRRGRPVPAPA